MTDTRRGRFFEDFKVGDVYRHAIGRTLSETDNTWFTLLTCNTNEIHFNADYAAQTEFGRPLMNSCLTLSLVTGLSVDDISQNIVANLGWDKVTLPAPVFAGDTIYAESEVLETRPSKSRPFRLSCTRCWWCHRGGSATARSRHARGACSCCSMRS